LVCNVFFFCFIYRSQNIVYEEHVVDPEDLCDKITSLLGINPDSELVIAGDFNVHNMKWLKHLKGNTREGTSCGRPSRKSP
jgi:hypothetical protein